MNDALYIAATGMQAQQTQLDAIANNVANANTTSFKRARVSFSDLVSRIGLEAQDAAPAAANAPAGVGVSSLVRQFTAGELKASDDPMSLAVQGDGFLEVLMPDGSTAYTRGSRLHVNAEQLLVTAEGYPLKQRISVAPDAGTISIAQDGQVSARDAKGRDWTLGRLDVVSFPNPGALVPMGDNLYRAAAGAGEPIAATPGEGGAGRLRQGFEEASNVKLIDEMVQLMVAQRAYEMNVKVIQAADEVAAMANNLRK